MTCHLIHHTLHIYVYQISVLVEIKQLFYRFVYLEYSVLSVEVF